MDASLIVGHLVGDYLLQDDWMVQEKTSSSIVAAFHAGLYTVVIYSVLHVEGIHWPLWSFLVCFASHFVIDRWRLAARVMPWVGQRKFKEKMGPWSVIVVDNTWHLVTLWLLSLAVVS